MKKRKIVILGAGHVGSHAAQAIAVSGVCEEVVLVDTETEKASAQAMDIADSLSFLPVCTCVRSGSYEEVEDADLIICAIGEGRKPGQTRLDLLDRSVVLLGTLCEQLKDHLFTCPMVTVTNPADIAADFMRKHLGLPRERCFGTGTLLDTARLVGILARAAGTAADSVCAYSLGEHGDSSMIPFSCVTIGGIAFDSLGLDRKPVLEATRLRGMDIIEGKKSTEFGIGQTCCTMAACILRDERKILPASVLLEGEYGQSGIHCGVPCRIGAEGILNIIELPLNEEEKKQFAASCGVIRSYTLRADSLSQNA